MNTNDATQLQRKSDKLGSICWIAFLSAGIIFCCIFVFIIANLWPITLILVALLALCVIIGAIANILSKSYRRKAQVASGQFTSIESVIEFEEQQKREQEAIIQDREERARRVQLKRDAEIAAAQHPECPACHGINTRRISTTKRVVSTSLVGLASSTIGKQYECLDCSHKW